MHTLGHWPGYYAAARADGSPLPSSGGRGRGTHLSSSYIRPPPSHQHQIMSSPDTPPLSQYSWKRRSAKFSQPWRRPLHTPPKGGVRTKNFCITFDTIFGRYLPRGTNIGGSRKCRMGAFCTIAKNSGEMSKKGLKTGQNGVNFFFNPHTY